MSKAYMLQPHGKGLANVMDFGSPTIIFDDSRPRPGMWRGDEYLREGLRRMEEDGYDPERDYFVVVGNMVLAALFCAALNERYPHAQVLCFDSITSEYVARRLGLSETLHRETAYGRR